MQRKLAEEKLAKLKAEAEERRKKEEEEAKDMEQYAKVCWKWKLEMTGCKSY